MAAFARLILYRGSSCNPSGFQQLIQHASTSARKEVPQPAPVGRSCCFDLSQVCDWQEEPINAVVVLQELFLLHFPVFNSSIFVLRTDYFNYRKLLGYVVYLM